jgi:hypothetical protein
MKFNLQEAAGRVAFLAEMAAGLEEHARTLAPSKYSWRIKPSDLGHECSAYLWNKFRWFRKEEVPGRIARIFEEGRRSEQVIADGLRGSGWTIRDVDPERAGKKIQQFKMTDLGGHLSNYIDGFGSHPVLTGGEEIICEYKSTHGGVFTKLFKEQSVAKVIDKYYIQCLLGMMYFDKPYTLFIAMNKNDSDIYSEIIPRNDDVAKQFIHRATDIVNASGMPGKVSQNASYFKCKMCEFSGICHEGETPDRNCRSCVNAVAIDGPNWQCNHWNREIPNDFLEAGCDAYKPII